MAKGKDQFGDILPVEEEQGADLRQVIETFRESWPLQLEFLALRAKLNFELYEQFRKAGFTDVQALELIKVKGP